MRENDTFIRCHVHSRVTKITNTCPWQRLPTAENEYWCDGCLNHFAVDLYLMCILFGCAYEKEKRREDLSRMYKTLSPIVFLRRFVLDNFVIFVLEDFSFV